MKLIIGFVIGWCVNWYVILPLIDRLAAWRNRYGQTRH